jgi:hypothetical protein
VALGLDEEFFPSDNYTNEEFLSVSKEKVESNKWPRQTSHVEGEQQDNHTLSFCCTSL